MGKQFGNKTFFKLSFDSDTLLIPVLGLLDSIRIRVLDFIVLQVKFLVNIMLCQKKIGY